MAVTETEVKVNSVAVEVDVVTVMDEDEVVEAVEVVVSGVEDAEALVVVPEESHENLAHAAKSKFDLF